MRTVHVWTTGGQSVDFQVPDAAEGYRIVDDLLSDSPGAAKLDDEAGLPVYIVRSQVTVIRFTEG